MEELRALRTFIAVAEHRSFAEAARRLHLSPTTVTRTIASLEASLGLALLVRTTRSVRLTEEGGQFLDRCRAGIAEIDGAFETARGGSVTPRGTLTVTAPVMFGRLHILPIIVELIERHPGLNVRLLLLDRVVRLVEEGIDVAVRIADLPDSALHMMKIGEVRRVLSASPAYLHAKGEPMQAADLRRHQLIAVENEAGAQGAWEGDHGKGLRGPARLSVNSVEAGIDAAVAGLGIVRTLSYQVAGHLSAGRLRQIGMDAGSLALPVSLLFQSGRRNTPNIRVFADLARERLRGAAL
ncbi:LysR family transcriptional regulator [Sphingomonas oryzagri]|uniref:LysR family transcriptional regulator n=1 Tax=Sphingomonas oryzagri TaxID=3042314 RepID=A0ABT6MZR3_9SPHN|nr:LysR family transcriptional regulator [Sphingomonas oryzagri]MDH7638297.1 LysR family transcriptional regulator [Sphingomonas oryzagri]